MSYVLKKFKNARSSANNRWFAYVNKPGSPGLRREAGGHRTILREKIGNCFGSADFFSYLRRQNLNAT